MVTAHHCPARFSKTKCTKANVRYTRAKKAFCGIHQVNCSKHDEAHMKTEDCPSCRAEKEAKERERMAKIQEEKDKKAREKAEKAEKQRAKTQAPLDKKIKTIGGKK